MKIESIDIDASIGKVQEMLKKEKGVSPSMKAAIEVLVLLVTLLINRMKLNSSNSSKPPSMDPNRKRKEKNNSGKKQGGQIGRKGVRLEKCKNPDKIKVIKIDRKTIPPGKYKEIG